MIRVATLLTVRNLARHRLRTLFTVIGIGLGVAAMIGVRLVNDSAARSFERTVERLAGKAVLQISDGEAGVPEKLLDEVRRIPGVSVAAPVVEGSAPVAGLPGQRLYVLGVDLLNGDSLREYDFQDTKTIVKDQLAFIAQPDSVALTTRFLRRHRLSLGDTIRILAPGGAKRLTIRGAMTVKRGPATLFDGRIAVMDVFAAQRLLALGGRFSRIDLGAKKGVKLVSLEAAVKRVVAGRGVVQRPERSGRTLERMLAGSRLAYSFGAALALVVGLYVIFNTMGIAVTQRRREFAILRAAGMRRGDLLRLVLGESLVLGALGCAIGAPLGVLFARAVVAAFAADVSRRLIPIRTGTVSVSPETIALGVGLGLFAALLAALIPARETLRIRALEALRRTDPFGAPSPKRALTMIGTALLALAASLFVFDWLYGAGPQAGGGVSYYAFECCALLGVSLTAPAFLRNVARAADRSLRASSKPLAKLAGRRLCSTSGRFSIATVALAVSLTGALAIAALTSSVAGTAIHWFDDNFGGIDLLVSTSPTASITDSTPLPRSLEREIAALPAVEAVDASRWLRVPYRGRWIELVARAPAAYWTGFRGLDLIEGERAEALAALSAEEGVLVSGSFARRFGKYSGDLVHLRCPSGTVALRIAGVVFDFDEIGEVIVSQRLYQRLWHDRTSTFLAVRLKDRGRSSNVFASDPRGVERVAAQIRRRFGDRYGLFVIRPLRLRGWLMSTVDRAVGTAYPVVLIAIGTALLGLINSLFASVLDRIREIGILRAIGATRGQVIRLVVMEAVGVGLTGGLAGAVLGSIEAYRFVTGTVRHGIGVSVFFHYPTWTVVLSLVAAVLLAATAGYFPGRAAGRIRVTEALEHE